MIPSFFLWVLASMERHLSPLLHDDHVSEDEIFVGMARFSSVNRSLTVVRLLWVIVFLEKSQSITWIG